MRFILSLFSSDVELGEKDQEGQKGDTAGHWRSQHISACCKYVCGWASAPTFDDMGAVLCALNASGLKGLQVLGYLSGSSKPTVSNASSAFKVFYKDVESQLKPDEIQTLPWNTVAEHSLCYCMFNRSLYNT